MTPPAARRIAKTLSLLGSPQDGEALAAARALARLLEGAGMDLHGLAALVATEMERRAAPPFTFATLTPRPARKMMGFLAWRLGVTKAERARLEILRDRLLKKNRLDLPAADIEWLDALWRRGNGGGGAGTTTTAPKRARGEAQGGSEGATNTRAWAPAREAGAWTVRAVRMPPVCGRVPLVFVEVERDGMRLTFAVARLRGGHLDVRPPRGPDGTGAGLWLPARERARVSALILAAVKDDADAWSLVRP